MTLILGALDGEIAAVVDGMVLDGTVSWNGFTIHRGTIEGRPVMVSRTGVGKTLSALLTQHLIDLARPSRILFTGLAGSLAPDLTVGDTLVARDCLIHDMDATSLGFEPGEIPYTPYRIIECDPALVEIAAGIVPTSGTHRIGRVLTGDQFIAGADVRKRLRQTFDGDAVEMEGASVGLVATVNHTPFLLIRTISDQADGTAGIDFNRFLKFASGNAWHYLKEILKEL